MMMPVKCSDVTAANANTILPENYTNLKTLCKNNKKTPNFLVLSDILYIFAIQNTKNTLNKEILDYG